MKTIPGVIYFPRVWSMINNVFVFLFLVGERQQNPVRCFDGRQNNDSSADPLHFDSPLINSFNCVI